MATKKKSTAAALREVTQLMHEFGARLDIMATALAQLNKRYDQQNTDSAESAQSRLYVQSHPYISEERLGWPSDAYDQPALVRLFSDLTRESAQRLVADLRRVHDEKMATAGNSFCVFKKHEWPEWPSVYFFREGDTSVELAAILVSHFEDLSVVTDDRAGNIIVYCTD